MKPKTVTAIRNRYPILLFLAGYFLFLLLTWADYGMTFDESGVYARGIGLSHYLAHDDYAGFVHKTSSDDGLVVYNHLYGMVLSWFNPITYFLIALREIFLKGTGFGGLWRIALIMLFYGTTLITFSTWMVRRRVL